MNRKQEIVAQIAAHRTTILLLNGQIAQLEAELAKIEADANRTAEVTYTATDKKRVFVNGQQVWEQGGKSLPARVKVVAYMDSAYLRNEDGTMKRDENGRGIYAETGEVAYDVTFSNMDPRKLADKHDGMVDSVNRLWSTVAELS